MNKELQKRILSSVLLIPISLFFIIKGSFFFDFFILICLLLSIYEWHLMSKKKNYYLLGIIFIFFSFYSAYFIRYEMVGDFIQFLTILLICISTDIGGYVFGKLFKGPKLTKISPNKTYSGMIGGYILSIILTSFFFKYLHLLKEGTSAIFDLNIFLTVLIISTVSQIGDILVSYFKRLSKIKDSGKLIPGHGGILDRIDGMIFAFPTSFIIVKLFY